MTKRDDTGGAHLHKRDPQLHNSLEVGHVVSFLRDDGIRIPNQPNAKLDAFVAFLSDIVNDGVLTGDAESIQRQIEAHVTAADDVSASFWTVQEGIAQKNGETLKPEKRAEIIRSAQETQRDGLHAWVDCLAAEGYPDWFRHWVWESVTRLGTYSPETEKYARRSTGTVSAFPDINVASLRDVYEQLTGASPPSGGFSKLYGAAIANRNRLTVVPEEEVEGRWERYHGRDDSRRLARDLQGKGIKWCVVSSSMGSGYLSNGDFWVFYTPDDSGNFNVPRMSISMGGTTRINEFCGRLGGENSGQEIEVELIDAAIAQARELGVGEPWERAAADVRRLRHLERRVESGDTEFSIEDLCWLYSPHEMNKFGYGTRSYYDNKRKAIIAGRDQQADKNRVDQVLNAAYYQTAEHLLGLLQQRGDVAQVEEQWLRKMTQREKDNFPLLAPTAAVEAVYREWMGGGKLAVAVDIRSDAVIADRWRRYQPLENYSAERDLVIAGVQEMVGRELSPAECAHVSRIVRYDQRFDITHVDGCPVEILDAVIAALGGESPLHGDRRSARRSYLQDARTAHIYQGSLADVRNSVIASHTQRTGHAPSEAETLWLETMVAKEKAAWSVPSYDAVATLADFIAADPLPAEIGDDHPWRQALNEVAVVARYTLDVHAAIEQAVAEQTAITEWQPSEKEQEWLKQQSGFDQAQLPTSAAPSLEAGQVLARVYADEQLPGPQFETYAEQWAANRTRWSESIGADVDTAARLVSVLHQTQGEVSEAEEQWLLNITARAKGNFALLAPTAAVEGVYRDWMDGAPLEAPVDIRTDEFTADRWSRYQALQKYSAERDRIIDGAQQAIGRTLTAAESAHIARIARYDRECDISKLAGCPTEVLGGVIAALRGESPLQGDQRRARLRYLEKSRITAIYQEALPQQQSAILETYQQLTGHAPTDAEAQWLKAVLEYRVETAWQPPTDDAAAVLADFVEANPLPEQIPEANPWRQTRAEVGKLAHYTRDARLALEQAMARRTESGGWQPSAAELDWLRIHTAIDLPNRGPATPPSFEAGAVLSDFYAMENLPGTASERYEDDWNRNRTHWQESRERLLAGLHFYKLNEFVIECAPDTPIRLVEAMATSDVTAAEIMRWRAAFPGEAMRRWVEEPKPDFDGAIAHDLQERAEANYEACKIAQIAMTQRARLSESLEAAGFASDRTAAWCQRLTGMVPSAFDGSRAELRSLPLSPDVVVATAGWLIGGVEGDASAVAAFEEFRRSEWARACEDIARHREPWYRRSQPWSKALRQANTILDSALGAG